MTEERLTCVSCKKNITNQKGSVQFQCPQCIKQTLVRCSHCRETAIRYKCPQCGFTGPN